MSPGQRELEGGNQEVWLLSAVLPAGGAGVQQLLRSQEPAK